LNITRLIEIKIMNLISLNNEVLILASLVGHVVKLLTVAR